MDPDRDSGGVWTRDRDRGIDWDSDRVSADVIDSLIYREGESDGSR